ncbi:MAG: class I SAM-dependent methyltransferase [Acidobacteria bacterium]|nr:class I SAM-dependent methyltransferase [Acidobacteriota bacterium]
MKQDNFLNFEEHNTRQIRYFEKIIKPSMVPSNSPYLKRQINELLQFAGISKQDHILEIGCGMGRYTLLLAQENLKVEGLDLSSVLLERLQNFNNNRFNISLHCSDISNPPRELIEKFDVIVGFFMLHHLHDLNSSFTGISRLLKPNGRVVFLEPNPFNPLYYLQILLTPNMTWEGDKGIVKMRPKLISQAMQNAGISDFAMSRFGFFPPFIANSSLGMSLEPILERVPIWKAFLPFQLFRGKKL